MSQVTLIGRQEIWPVHQKTADLGGMLSSCAARLDRRMGINMALDIDAYDTM